MSLRWSCFVDGVWALELFCDEFLCCRMFLCLFAGGVAQQLPQGLGSESGSRQTVYTSVRWVGNNFGIQLTQCFNRNVQYSRCVYGRIHCLQFLAATVAVYSPNTTQGRGCRNLVVVPMLAQLILHFAGWRNVSEQQTFAGLVQSLCLLVRVM